MNLLPWELEHPKILVKDDEKTNPKWGKPISQRTVEELLDCGVVNLNKTSGPTSHIEADWAKKILKLETAGHGGTLDPNVTGCLIVGLMNATKILRAMLLGGKEYVCLMHIHKQCDEKKIREVMKSFIGEITQMPPKKSNVKRVFRQRTVYYLEVLEIKDNDVLFVAGTEAGTYIRTLCVDIGKKLGVGAHMMQLVRTRSGPFNNRERFVTLQDLQDAYDFWKEGNDKFIRYCIQPVENAVAHFKKIWISDAAVNSVCHGAKVAAPGLCKLHDNIKIGDMVAVMTLKDELIALGTAQMNSKEMMDAKKGISVSLERVVMKQETYPKLWKKK